MPVDEKLVTALKRAKSATAVKPHNFVFVMKGGTDGGLLVSQQKVPPGDIAEVKKSTGGSAVLKGICFGEDGKLIFEMAKDPAATMAPALKKVIKRDANLVYNVECRKGTNPLLAEDAQDTALPVALKTPVKPAESAADEWKRRLADLTPRLKEALRIGDKKIVGEIKTSFALADSSAQAKDFGRALSRLPSISELIDKALASPSGTPSAPPPKPPEWSTRLPDTPQAPPAKPLNQWQQASKDVAGRVVQLQGVLRQTKIPVLREMGDEMLAAVRKYVTELSTALLEYEKAAGDAKGAARRKAAALVDAFSGKIAKDDIVLRAADMNPFGVKVAARETLGKSLQALHNALAG
jgi:hypothetical protein